MNGGGGSVDIRRILVAIDAAPASVSTLETAANLAAALNAELHGIYVEDINLLRLAGLPFAREFAWSSATELHLDYQRMERVLRGRSSHARQAVLSISNRLKVQGSLQVARGHVVQELLQAAGDVDLLILGKGGTKRMGSVALRVAQEAPCSVLLLTPQGLSHPQVFMVDFKGRSGDENPLFLAARLARLLHGRLIITLSGSTSTDIELLQKQASKLLGEDPRLMTYQPVKTSDAGYYERLIRVEQVSLAVCGATEEELADLDTRLAALECSLLITR